MAVTRSSPSIDPTAARSGYSLDGLKRAAYERVASMLVALLFLLGLAVLLLLITWLTMQIFVKQTAVPVQMEEIGTGEGEGRPGGGSGQEFEPPPPEEVNFEPPVDDPLTAISSVVTTKAPMLEELSLNEERRTGKGKGIGRGIGDGIGDGTGGRPRRWEVQFPPGNTLKTYAKQLDFFGIELGILVPGNKVVYASKFSRPKPETRTGPADQEKRYYLTWRRGELMAADRELLAKAGATSESKMILKFVLPQVEARLVALERASADQKGQKKIYKTVFGVRADGAGYAFYVLEQTYE